MIDCLYWVYGSIKYQSGYFGHNDDHYDGDDDQKDGHDAAHLLLAFFMQLLSPLEVGISFDDVVLSSVEGLLYGGELFSW